jgi:hypothetical protein
LGRQVVTIGWSRINSLISCEFDLLRLCPQIVLGKYVAITSIDSGAFKPTEKEVAVGWQSRGKIAYSPQVQRVEEIPSAGWDEWYIFDKPLDLGTSHLAENIFEAPQEQGHVSDFVNYGFALHPPERAEKLALLFWPQIDRIRPESYVADNDYLTFGSANKDVFTNVLNAINALG